MTTQQLIWALVIAVVLGGSLAYLFWKQRQQAKAVMMRRKQPQQAGAESGLAFVPVQLQLQAYERLILLTERIALPNLISRLKHDGFTARDMQGLLTESIRQEFEHNITQQIY